MITIVIKENGKNKFLQVEEAKVFKDNTKAVKYFDKKIEESKLIKKLRVLSLGAGVQSTTLALMIEHGEIPMVDCAIFADTPSEPKKVYKHLDWLKSKLSYPLHIVTKGNLRKDVIDAVDGKYKSIFSFCHTFNHASYLDSSGVITQGIFPCHPVILFLLMASVLMFSSVSNIFLNPMPIIRSASAAIPVMLFSIMSNVMSLFPDASADA